MDNLPHIKLIKGIFEPPQKATLEVSNTNFVNVSKMQLKLLNASKNATSNPISNY